ncbi:MAG: flagellar biosynthetic protein FliO, partial [Gemmatimonadetes bacterium]|nr:flagellar biosynthetic protein FliO [Gemmatimonadota bacterium]
MLIAGVGMAAALAFVLGLGALALWALRRFGGATLGRRGRLPMEVVQRVSLGPRMQLAVVRVGEKVMAVSLGEGRVDALFELAAEDRERVLAGSTVPVPLPSSEAAQAGIDRMATPSPMDAHAPAPVLAPSFGASLAQAMGPRALGAPSAPVPAPGAMSAAMSTAPAAAFAPRPNPVRRAPGPLPRFRKDEPREIPGFLTAPRRTHGAPFPALLLLGLLLVPRAESRAQAATTSAATAAAPITAPAPAATQLTTPTPPTPPAAAAVPGARASTAAQVA